MPPMPRIALVLLLLLACVGLPCRAQVAAPDDWRKETFAFPLQFAPTIPYEGTEHVRFAPYWAKFDEPRGFTYVILWDIRRRTLEAAQIERALDVYFDGLMDLITRTRKVDDPGTVTSVALHPMAEPAGWSWASGGKLWTWNGFSKGEALELNLEVTQRACGQERTQVFFAFSRAERTREDPWKVLRDIRARTAC
jgi:hypothetical protein